MVFQLIPIGVGAKFKRRCFVFDAPFFFSFQLSVFSYQFSVCPMYPAKNAFRILCFNTLFFIFFGAIMICVLSFINTDNGFKESSADNRHPIMTLS